MTCSLAVVGFLVGFPEALCPGRRADEFVLAGFLVIDLGIKGADGLLDLLGVMPVRVVGRKHVVIGSDDSQVWGFLGVPQQDFFIRPGGSAVQRRTGGCIAQNASRSPGPLQPDGVERRLLRGAPDRLPVPPLRLVRFSTGTSSVRWYFDGGALAAESITSKPVLVKIYADGVVRDSGEPDPVVPDALQHPVEDLPSDTLLFLLPSRYCEVELMLDLAWKLFEKTPFRRLQALSNRGHCIGTGSERPVDLPCPACVSFGQCQLRLVHTRGGVAGVLIGDRVDGVARGIGTPFPQIDGRAEEHGRRVVGRPRAEFAQSAAGLFVLPGQKVTPRCLEALVRLLVGGGVEDRPRVLGQAASLRPVP